MMIDGDDGTLIDALLDDGYQRFGGNPIDAGIIESHPCPECGHVGMTYTALELGRRGEARYSYRAVASCSLCRYEMEV